MLERDAEIEAMIRDFPNAEEIIKVRNEELKRIQTLLNERHNHLAFSRTPEADPLFDALGDHVVRNKKYNISGK